jgi:hypothetical protein
MSLISPSRPRISHRSSDDIALQFAGSSGTTLVVTEFSYVVGRCLKVMERIDRVDSTRIALYRPGMERPVSFTAPERERPSSFERALDLADPIGLGERKGLAAAKKNLEGKRKPRQSYRDERLRAVMPREKKDGMETSAPRRAVSNTFVEFYARLQS